MILLVVKLTTFSIIERYSEIGALRAMGQAIDPKAGDEQLRKVLAEVTPRPTGDDWTQRVQRYVADWRAEYAGHKAKKSVHP